MTAAGFYSDDQYAGPVALFMKAAGQPVGQSLDRNTPSSEIDLRLRLMDEELDELFEAITMRDPVQTAKEAADLIYVVLGTCIAFGIPIAEVFQAVANSNLSKINPATGKPYQVDAHGKVMKGSEYQDPTEEISLILSTKLVVV